MDQTFIQDAQRDVDGHDGGQQQERHVLEAALQLARVAGELAMHVNWHIDLGHGAVDRGHCIAQAFASRQVERESGGNERALVIDRQRRGAGAKAGDRRQRHHGGNAGGHRRAGRTAAAHAGGQGIELLVAHRFGRFRRRVGLGR